MTQLISVFGHSDALNYTLSLYEAAIAEINSRETRGDRDLSQDMTKVNEDAW